MGSTGVINGTDLLVYSDSNAIGYSTSCSISLSQDNPVVTSKDDGKWAARLQGNRDGTISTDGYVALDGTYNFSYLWGLLISQTEVGLRYSTETSGDTYYQVQGVISSLSSDASDNEGVTYSVEFEFNGTPQEVTLT